MKKKYANFYTRLLESMLYERIHHRSVSPIFLTVDDWFKLVNSAPEDRVEVYTTKSELTGQKRFGVLTVRGYEIPVCITEDHSFINAGREIK
jgi:hypothetical protein